MMALFADIGVPMIGLILPAAWALLIPVIFIETCLGIRITKLPFRRTLVVATASNCFSMLLGVPLAWLTMATVEVRFFGSAKDLDSVWAKIYAVTVQSPWLIPYDKDLDWMVPTAGLVLVVPLWLMSVVTEYLIVKWMLPELSADVKWRWTWKANMVSYAFLLAFVLALPISDPVISGFGTLLRPITDFLVHVVMAL
jgi:hypothetical protein